MRRERGKECPNFRRHWGLRKGLGGDINNKNYGEGEWTWNYSNCYMYITGCPLQVSIAAFPA